MNRRGAVLGAVGVAAAVAGAGIAWRRHAPRPAQGDGALSAPEAMATLWSLRLDRPDGGTLALADARGRPMVVNFWATWCVPCVEEMPLLDRFFRAARADGWQVVGLALDGADAVRRFLARYPVSFPVGLLGGEGLGLAHGLGNAVGGLPFSVFVDAAGRVADRRLGKLDDALLAVWKGRA